MGKKDVSTYSSLMVSLPDTAEEHGYLGLPRGTEEEFDTSFSCGDSMISGLRIFGTRSSWEQKLNLSLKGLSMRCFPSDACCIGFLQGESMFLLLHVSYITNVIHVVQ